MNDMSTTEPIDAGTPGIGSNSLPMGISLPTMPEYKAHLDYELAEARERLLDLRVGLDRLPAVVDANNAGQVTDFIAQCKKAVTSAEAGRKKRKEPLLDLTKAHDAYFAALAAPVQKVIENAMARLQVWHDAEKKRVAAENAERERLARIEREKAEAEAEAARVAAEAASQAANDTASREAAVRAQAIAADAAEAADAAAKAEAAAAKPDAHRTRGESGASLGYTTTHWEFDVDNIALVPAAFLMVDDKAVREHIAEAKANKEAPAIPGIAFRKVEKLIVKGS